MKKKRMIKHYEKVRDIVRRANFKDQVKDQVKYPVYELSSKKLEFANQLTKRKLEKF